MVFYFFFSGRAGRELADDDVIVFLDLPPGTRGAGFRDEDDCRDEVGYWADVDRWTCQGCGCVERDRWGVGWWPERILWIYNFWMRPLQAGERKHEGNELDAGS